MEPIFSNERVITVEGDVDSINLAEKEISRKLRQCMERDMRTLMSVGTFDFEKITLSKTFLQCNLR